tara:strand:+ start:315 stop:536 length:222 start_codon:yes stop_codon:yes gene_type:complete
MEKTFKEIRERAARKKHPPGQHIMSKKLGKRTLMVHKQGNKFITYIDNEKLDSYRSKAEAEKMGKEFIKQFKG